MHQRRALLQAAAALALPLAGRAAPAQQDYPWRPIRIVVPALPGSGPDAVARLLARELAQTRGWRCAVDNVPVAGGNLGVGQVVRAPKDGHSVVVAESSNLVINPEHYRRLGFDVERDLQPVALLARVPLVLVVGADSPHAAAPALAAAGRRRMLVCASSGHGTVSHLVAQAWKRSAGLSLMHVPYKSAPPALADVASDRVDLYFAPVPATLPLLRAGKVRALAVTSPARVDVLPGVPTLVELGHRELQASVVFGLLVPTGTPPATVRRLNQEANGALATPRARQVLTALGADATAPQGDAALFADYLQQEREKWRAVRAAAVPGN